MKNSTAARVCSATALALSLIACTGAIEGASSAAGGPVGDGAGPAAGAAAAPGKAQGGGSFPVSPTTPESAGELPLRRLSRLEYDSTVRDLLGDTSHPAQAFADEEPGGSGFREPGKVSEVEARRYGDAAEQVAASVVRDLPKLMGCAPVGAGEAACVSQWLPSFARRAYRRPLAATEAAELQAFYQGVRARHEPADAIALVLQAVLQSPSFLYHWEVGDAPAVAEGALVKLGGYQLASRLSYLLWKSMPDAALFAAADAGKLDTPEQVAAQARRMLADTKARAAIDDFHLQWARIDFRGVDKDRQTYPLWTSALAQTMTDEAAAFAEGVLARDGRLSSLLTAPVGYLNAALAKVYGVAGVTGDAPRETALDPAQRAGVFTLAGFLAAQGAEAGSHPIKRGKVIWESALCGVIPPPPMNVPPPRAPTPGLTTRERFAEHARNECAAACHALFDPPGFAFESYDGIGQWRTTDAGKPVDTSGVLRLPSGDRPFAGAVEMLHAVAGSDEARRCAVSQWARYALLRHEGADDGGSLARAYQAFMGGALDVRELIVALVSSKTFRYRRPAPGEVL